MTARQRGLAMVAIALGGVIAAGGLAIAMRRTRAAQHETYERDRDWLRKRAGATRAPRRPEPTAPAARRHCVAGVDTFVVAVARALVEVPRADRTARLAALLQASDWAVRAEKLAELERPAPTLPQRMGSVADPTAPGGRKPLEAARTACDGKGFGEVPDYRPRTADGGAKKPVDAAKPTDAKKPGAAAKKPAKKPAKKKPAKKNP